MIITKDGTYLLNTGARGDSNSQIILYTSGTFSTATCKLQYEDEAGNFIDLEDGAVLVDTQNSINKGVGARIFLNVASADGSTSIVATARAGG